MSHTNGSGTLRYFPLVAQEVNRRLALGVPRGVDRSDLESRANEALVVAVSSGTRAIRLAIRHALVDLVRYEGLRGNRAREAPAETVRPPITTPMPERGRRMAVGELFYILTPRQQEAVHLVFYEGLTQDETAGRMNCCQQDISSLLSCAQNKLRAEVVKKAV
jgi:predicted DNA-binding protein (UPF0251 family)